MKKPKCAGVYRIRSSEGKNYVGSSSKDWAGRLNHHRFLLKRGRHYNRALQADWDRLGGDKFVFFLVCECAAERAREMEEIACKEFRAYEKDGGYNQHRPRLGYYGGRKPSGEDLVRFSHMLPRSRAVAMAKLIKLDEDMFLRLYHSVNRIGHLIKYKGIGERACIQETEFDSDFSARILDGTYAAENMDIDGKKDREIARLSARVRELEAKVRELEGVGFDQGEAPPF